MSRWAHTATGARVSEAEPTAAWWRPPPGSRVLERRLGVLPQLGVGGDLEVVADDEIGARAARHLVARRLDALALLAVVRNRVLQNVALDPEDDATLTGV